MGIDRETGVIFNQLIRTSDLFVSPIKGLSIDYQPILRFRELVSLLQVYALQSNQCVSPNNIYYLFEDPFSTNGTNISRKLHM